MTAWGVDGGPAPVSQQTLALTNGLSTASFPTVPAAVLALDYQVGFVGAGNVQEVTTATISAGTTATTSCSVTASALTTG